MKHERNSSWPNITGFSGILSLRTDGFKSKTVESRLEAAVKHDSIDTASEIISETLVEACKQAGLKARGGKIKSGCP